MPAAEVMMLKPWQEDRIGSAENGTNPAVLCRMKSGYAVIGDTQFLKGYCVLMAAPRVASLDDLPMNRRTEFLTDMAIVGEAVRDVFSPVRMNYSVLGNSDPFLHAHIFPRHAYEDPARLKKPVWLYPPENWSADEYWFENVLSGDELRVLAERIDEIRGYR
jgi:diadenosine tetraphosphate (Ap4A) HIT family hydrolase